MVILSVVNIVVILLIGNIAIRALSDYCMQKKAGKVPTFVAKDIGLDNTDVWK